MLCRQLVRRDARHYIRHSPSRSLRRHFPPTGNKNPAQGSESEPRGHHDPNRDSADIWCNGRRPLWTHAMFAVLSAIGKSSTRWVDLTWEANADLLGEFEQWRSLGSPRTTVAAIVPCALFPSTFSGRKC